MFRCLFVLAVVGPLLSPAQSYPQGYFRNPLGIPISLAGNFGECRPGHFHMGLDLKTGGRENLPVYAAADGWVSRIKTEPGGFGHAIYLTHPNGYTTVYAHLNDFFPALQKHLRAVQYAQESWTVDEALKPESFPVLKGQQIAWSGNTGGSTAPHLHFEIRDTKTERALNPQLFGFAIRDTRPPVPAAVVLYDLTESVYAATPATYPLRQAGAHFQPAEPVLTAPLKDIGVGVVADDFMDGSTNTLAFHTAEIYVDDMLQMRIALDEIGYDETRYLHAYADYRAKQQGGPWIQQLFQLPGNALDRIYTYSAQSGGVLQPGRDTMQVRIVLTDAAGNKSHILFRLRATDPVQRGEGCMNGERKVRPAEAGNFETPNLRVVLPSRAFYDAVCLRPARKAAPAASVSDRYAVGNPGIPVHTYFDLALKPSSPVPFALRRKLALLYSDGKKVVGRAAEPEAGGWYKASVRALGDYWLAADTGRPVIKPIGAISGFLQGKNIAFTALDATTSVKQFHGELDGRWILFEQHEDRWIYVFDEHCPPGRHTLTVRATDEVGNETRKQFSFSR